jgi:hypothetical protein
LGSTLKNSKTIYVFDKITNKLLAKCNSQVQASRFIGFSDNYISNRIQSGVYENYYYRWKILTPNSNGGYDLQWEAKE